MFDQSGQCRSKIRLQVLCSLILICTSCQDNYSTERHFNLFSTKPLVLRVCRRILLKTLWEKEKLLITSNFSFFPQCFLPIWKTQPFSLTFKIFIRKLFQVGKVQNLSFGKGLRDKITTIGIISNDHLAYGYLTLYYVLTFYTEPN